jgi:thiol-disulfide isomerase/thioredoxin
MKSSERKSNSSPIKWKVAAAIVFVIFGIGAIYYVRASYLTRFVTFDNADGTTSSLDLSVFESTPFSNVATGTMDTISFTRSEYTLLILLAGGDCPNCLAERKLWAELAQNYGDGKLQIVGVMNRTSSDEAASFAKGFDLPFSVLLDKENKIGGSTAMPTTPFKILLKNGKPVIAAGPTGDQKTQRKWLEKIKNELDTP